jgi:DNA repair exonuclease SbcCD ATPase subunit
VRAITAARQEIEESRQLLDDVSRRMRGVQDTASALDERKRQMGKAEERLARADGLLVDVRSSLEVLQGQKALVDEAVERTGSLQFLLKQAEAMIEGLRGERKLTADVRAAVAIGGQDDDEEGDTRVAKAA